MLDLNIRLLPTIKKFKLKVTAQSLHVKTRPWFNIGDRKLSIIRAKLRMECSSLKDHLYNLNIIEDSSCPCGHNFESNYHFFTECALYNTERNDLFTGLLNLNFDIHLDYILLGNENCSVEEQ